MKVLSFHILQTMVQIFNQRKMTDILNIQTNVFGGLFPRLLEIEMITKILFEKKTTPLYLGIIKGII